MKLLGGCARLLGGFVLALEEELVDERILLQELVAIRMALQLIAKQLEEGVVKTEDVGRARVYSEHLGKSLRPSGAPGEGQK